jgi:hypothetical protein
MEAIVKQLANPEWWFSVVVVGLLVGTVATYAREWLSRGLSSVSKRFAIYAERRRALRTSKVDLLTRLPQLLVIDYIRACIGLMGTLVFLISSYLVPAWNVLQKIFPEVNIPSSVIGFSSLSDTSSAIMSLVFLVLGFISWGAFVNLIGICEAARLKIVKNEP